MKRKGKVQLHFSQMTALDSNLKKLPELCYVHVPGEDVLCMVKRGESGYYRTDFKLWEDPKAFAAEMNERLKVTASQASAMYNGSMFGWHTPGADADHEANQVPEKFCSDHDMGLGDDSVCTCKEVN